MSAQTPVTDGITTALTETAKARPVSVRAFVLGAALIPINLYWLISVEYVRYSDNASTQALYFNTVFLLLALLLINLGLGRLFPRRNFTRGEMLTVYVMLVVSTGLAGHDQMQILFTTLHYAVARATEQNGWISSITPYLPGHLVPHNGPALKDLYQGNSTLYTPNHYLVWIGPLTWWSAFVMAVVWVMMCMTTIFRKQWDAERLTYPIAEIPLQLTDPDAGVLKSKLFWLAFAFAASIRAWVYLQLLFPSLPAMNINCQYYYLADNGPLRAAGQIPVSFFPFGIGLCFFLPVQISFSIWFFYILSRLEMVAASALGWQVSWGNFPYVAEQSTGSAIGWSLAVLWFARKHLRRVFAHALGGDKLDDSEEPMSYSLAFWGFIFGCVFLIYFAIHAGMRPFTAYLYFGIFLMLVLVVARLRAEVGLPTIEFYQVGADKILRSITGDRVWTGPESAVMSLFFWLSRTHRQFPMSSQLDAMRIGRRSGVTLRSLTWAVLLASGITVITAFWAMLHVVYHVGFATAKFSSVVTWAFGLDPWTKMHGCMTAPSPADPGRVGGYVFGMLFTFLLSAMRARFPWWPFHPAGYLTSGSFGLSRLIVPIFIAWAAKASILRFGGLSSYRKALPFFLGLICGEFVIGMLGTLIGFWVQIPQSAGLGGL
jgi:hypothetical protein